MRREKEKERDEKSREMIYSCFPPLDQAQDGFVCVFLGCLAEQREKTGKEGEMGKRGERKGWESRESGKQRGIGEIKKEKQKN